MHPPLQVSVIGAGYVGLVTAAVLADMGHRVRCVECNPEKLATLQRGCSPIYEPGVEQLIRRAQSAGTLDFTSDLASAVSSSEIVFVAVGTPPQADGAPDISNVMGVALDIANSISGYTLVVNKSTVPIGTGRRVEQLLLEHGVHRSRFDIVSNPEFLREGTAVKDTIEADRIVIGAWNPAAADMLAKLFAPLGRPLMMTDVESAELIKYACNSFLAMKISFINAMSRICELTGANVGEVAKGMGYDPRIGDTFLEAGLGWGGSCFPKDVKGLIKISESLGYDFGLLKEVDAINEGQTRAFIDRLEVRLGGFAGKRIAIWGLAFKPNTDDVRDARSLVIIERITVAGGHVCAYDPIASDNMRAKRPDVEYASDPCAAATGADAVILVTEWDEFRHINLQAVRSAMRVPLLFDGRRAIDRSAAIAAGLEYHTIGENSPIDSSAGSSAGRNYTSVS